MKGVSDKDIKEFSQRKNNILEIAGVAGISDVKGLEYIEYIAKSTRAEKIKETPRRIVKKLVINN
jgi:hypothetical protein